MGNVTVFFTVCILMLNIAYSQEKEIPFHLRFTGKSSDGFEVVFSQYNLTFRKAVKVCVNVCKDPWWCSALHKCADRRRTFQCDVICPWKSETVANKTRNQYCTLAEAHEVRPNVAAHKAVRVAGTIYDFSPHYATDTNTVCPLNMLFVHTIFAEDPWLEIVFGQSVDVAMVVVYNRQHSYAERFRNALIDVAEENVWRPCGFYKGPGVEYQIIFIICNEAVRGDILKITLKTVPGEQNALQLCEVEDATSEEANTNLPLPKWCRSGTFDCRRPLLSHVS